MFKMFMSEEIPREPDLTISKGLFSLILSINESSSAEVPTA